MLSDNVTREELLHYTTDLENLKESQGITWKEVGMRIDEVNNELDELDIELSNSKCYDPYCPDDCEACDVYEIDAIANEINELKCERDQLKQLLLSVPWD